jgi:hypothetical protein
MQRPQLTQLDSSNRDRYPEIADVTWDEYATLMFYSHLQYALVYLVLNAFSVQETENYWKQLTPFTIRFGMEEESKKE